MSITRRQFLLGTSAGLILPSYFEKAHSYFANHGEPLLLGPKSPGKVLYAEAFGGDRGFEMLLGTTDKNPPGMTLREFAEWQFETIEDYLVDCCGEDPDDLHPELWDWDEAVDAEILVDVTPRNEFPCGAAYEYLQYLDLGEELESARAAGELRFIDGSCPGNDYLGVEASDAVTLSLLQQRLNELEQNVLIKLA